MTKHKMSAIIFLYFKKITTRKEDKDMEGLASIFMLLLYIGIVIVVIRTIVHYAARVFAEEIVNELEKRGKL
jgi:hypothetical protein